MTNSTFEPEGIRTMGSGHAAKATAATSASLGIIGSVGQIKLPKILASQQGELNALLGRVAAGPQMLASMAESFAAKTRAAADSYEKTEAANTDLGAQMGEF